MTATTLHKFHYTTTTTPLRYNHNYSCSTSHYIQQLWVRWPLQPLQPLQQTQLQPPFGQSVDSLCHPWFTTTNVSYRFPILKLPPPPCAVLLVGSNHQAMENTGSKYGWTVYCHPILGILKTCINPYKWIDDDPPIWISQSSFSPWHIVEVAA